MSTAETLNEKVRALDERDDVEPVPYFGWYWRDVDWDRGSVSLAVSPSSRPSWYGHTGEALLGLPWKGGEVRFCESNKWGYEMFRVEGDDFTALKRLVEKYATDPTDEAYAALVHFMASLAPEGIAERSI